MSTRLRQLSLAPFRLLGFRRITRRSALGQPFICHLGDVGSENPVYNREHCRLEIALMAGWVEQFSAPTVIDVGANVGFIATQLGSLLRDRGIRIHALEPVPSTYAKLAAAVRLLHLSDVVFPICCAMSSAPGFARIWFSERDSLFAQISEVTPAERVGAESALCPLLTVDALVTSLGVAPCLLKVDVEGQEASVLQGAAKTLGGSDRPAVCFELNPTTLREAGRGTAEIVALLGGYRFHYVDDFEGQRLPFGAHIEKLEALDWVCNVFAVPGVPNSGRRWDAALEAARSRYLRPGR